MRHSKKKRKRLPQEMNLQITSLADILVILLVFLLKSFSSTASNFSQKTDLVLPVAVTETEKFVESTKVELSKMDLILDDTLITKLQDYQFASSDLEMNGSPRPLNTAFLNLKKKKESSDNNQLRMLILADQNVPYKTIKKVLASASFHGFIDYKLVLVKKE
jgi:biopolymer transport protein ExbD